MNIAITLVTNYLFANLSKKEFRIATVLIAELGKSMFSMELLREISHRDEK